MKKLYPPEAKLYRRMFGIFDDFAWYISPHMWTSLTEDNSTVAIDADGECGIVQLTVGTDNNEEAGLFTTNELFILAADQPLYGMALIQYTETNTDDANVAFGFADAMAADLLSDDGGGDNIPNTGALIFKVDGGTVWRAACENNGTINESASNTTAGGTSYQLLEIFGIPVDATYFEFTYFVNNNQLTDSTTGQPICHRLAYASATQMDFGVYAKTGAAQTETVNVDLAGAWQLRPSARLY